MKSPLKTFISLTVIVTFLMTLFVPVPAQAEVVLPAPGTMVYLSQAMNPPILKGIKINATDPLKFDFILDQGSNKTNISSEANKLIKYFLAALTTPEKDLWVNLSPFEKDRIVPDSFGQTEMGRDLLAQDYLLKQITASLVYPEDQLGKEFWKRVYQASSDKQVPINTFNKVWIVPSKAVVYENAKAGTAYVVESSLKVLTEQDYLASTKDKEIPTDLHQEANTNQSAGTTQAIRQIVLPQLEREVNEGANFAQLRQVYNSLILATWYKNKIKASILNQVYADKNKIAGVNIDDPQEKHKIYERYLEAFKKGAFNYIKDTELPNGISSPTKYFSGGVKLSPKISTVDTFMPNVIKGDFAMVGVKLIPSPAMLSSTDAWVKAFDKMDSRGNQYTQAIYESTEVIHDAMTRLAKKEGKSIADLMPAGSTIVVAGFGNHWQELKVFAHLFPHCKVLGVDWLERNVNQAKENLKAYKNIEIELKDIRFLDRKNENVQMLYSSYLMEHTLWWDRHDRGFVDIATKEIFGSLYGQLQPGGYFVSLPVSLSTSDSLKEAGADILQNDGPGYKTVILAKKKIKTHDVMFLDQKELENDGRSKGKKAIDVLSEIFMATIHSQKENRLVVMNRLRQKAVFWKEMGENGIYFQPEIVDDPADFDYKFEKGKKILKLHLDGIGRDKLRALIKIGFSHPVLNQMNAAGYEGVYTQTGNKGIRILFLREKQGIEIKTSFVTTVKTSLTGLYGTIFYGYPKSGMPKRIVFTFKETGNSAQRAKEDKAMPPNAFKGKEVFETDRAMTGLEEYPTADEVAYHVARRMADVLKANNSKGRTTRMIVPTGGTYEAVYKKFLEIIADEQINCAGLITFNMDEYYQVDDAHSFREYMENHLFRHLRHLNLGWKDNNAHMLDGSTKDIDAEVKAYEQAIKDGGIDLALGGIGRDGHIAFNEPIIRVGRQGITLQQARDFNEFVLVDVPIDEQEGIIRNVRSQRAQAHTGPAFEEYLKFNLKSQDVAGLAARLYTQPIAIYKNLEDLPKSRTRLVQLALPSIIDNSRYFKDINQMPIEALTIGIETLNDAKAIIIAATGANKADAVAEVSATLLTGHDNLTWVVDQEAAMTKPGGIDLNPTKMDLETQNAGEAINLHMDPAKLKQLQNAPGFTPVIINIVPLIDVKTFLGIVS